MLHQPHPVFFLLLRDNLGTGAAELREDRPELSSLLFITFRREILVVGPPSCGDGGFDVVVPPAPAELTADLHRSDRRLAGSVHPFHEFFNPRACADTRTSTRPLDDLARVETLERGHQAGLVAHPGICSGLHVLSLRRLLDHLLHLKPSPFRLASPASDQLARTGYLGADHVVVGSEVGVVDPCLGLGPNDPFGSQHEVDSVLRAGYRVQPRPPVVLPADFLNRRGGRLRPRRLTSPIPCTTPYKSAPLPVRVPCSPYLPMYLSSTPP